MLLKNLGKNLLEKTWRPKISFVHLHMFNLNKGYMKKEVIDGMIYDNEIGMWITVEEYLEEYSNEPDFSWDWDLENAR